jgi:hypothetical protein
VLEDLGWNDFFYVGHRYKCSQVRPLVGVTLFVGYLYADPDRSRTEFDLLPCSASIVASFPADLIPGKFRTPKRSLATSPSVFGLILRQAIALSLIRRHDRNSRPTHPLEIQISREIRCEIQSEDVAEEERYVELASHRLGSGVDTLKTSLETLFPLEKAFLCAHEHEFTPLASRDS